MYNSAFAYLNFTRKKISNVAFQKSTKRIQDQIKMLKSIIQNFTKEDFIWIDECHVTHEDCRARYGYIEKRSSNRITQEKLTDIRYSFIVAISWSGKNLF